MREFEIQLSSVQEVQAFVSLSTTRPFPVHVSDGSHRVNGKSFMEMFCLDFTRPLTVSIDCGELDADIFQVSVSRFRVK